MLMKLVTLLVVLVLWLLFFWIRKTGRANRLARIDNAFDYDEKVARHRTLVRVFCLVLVVAIVAIEYQVSTNQNSRSPSLLRDIHFVLDGMATVTLLAMVTGFTGTKNRAWHNTLGGLFYLLFFLITVTGLMLLYSL
jgi:hypothetical protein